MVLLKRGYVDQIARKLWEGRHEPSLGERLLPKIYGDAGMAGPAGYATDPQSFVTQQFLAGGSFTQFATQYGGGGREIIREPTYSFKAYPTAGQTQLTFFDQGFGAATNGFGDTNMQQPSNFPQGEAFLVTNIRVIPLPARADYEGAAGATPVCFGDWTEVMNRNCGREVGWAQKPYLRVGPLVGFPQGFGSQTVVEGNATVTKNISWPSFGSQDQKALFLLQPPLAIAAMQN